MQFIIEIKHDFKPSSFSIIYCCKKYRIARFVNFYEIGICVRTGIQFDIRSFIYIIIATAVHPADIFIYPPDHFRINTG